MDYKERLLELLANCQLYEEDLVRKIDEDALIHPIRSFQAAIRSEPKTVKIEAMERVFSDVYEESQRFKTSSQHPGPVNAHLFWALPGSPSFPEHTDPNDVLIVVKYGTKVMEVDGQRFELTVENPELFIPANTPHRALNEHESIMISYGLLDYIEDRVPF